MKTVKMDKGLARYIIEHQDEDDFSVDVEECEKCMKPTKAKVVKE